MDELNITNTEILNHRDCSYWVVCNKCGRLDGNFSDEEEAYTQANSHRSQNPGHKPKVKSDCV